MAAPAKGVQQPQPEPFPVVISEDPISMKLKVSDDPFWVTAEQEVHWICKRNHIHGAGLCFVVKFENKGIFKRDTFEAGEHTGKPRGDAPHKIPFNYVVEPPPSFAQEAQVRQGGVRPVKENMPAGSEQTAQSGGVAPCVAQGGVRP